MQSIIKKSLKLTPAAMVAALVASPAFATASADITQATTDAGAVTTYMGTAATAVVACLGTLLGGRLLWTAGKVAFRFFRAGSGA